MQKHEENDAYSLVFVIFAMGGGVVFDDFWCQKGGPDRVTTTDRICRVIGCVQEMS